MNEELICMGDYCSVRIWQLKTRLHSLRSRSSSQLGIHRDAALDRWCQARSSLQRVSGHGAERYVLHTTFSSEARRLINIGGKSRKKKRLIIGKRLCRYSHAIGRVCATL